MNKLTKKLTKMTLSENTTLPEALKILGIEEYGQRIFSSNSTGELFHITQYFELAETIGTTKWFPKWFKLVVEFAEKEWERPESVFQHIQKILIQHIRTSSKCQSFLNCTNIGVCTTKKHQKIQALQNKKNDYETNDRTRKKRI